MGSLNTGEPPAGQPIVLLVEDEPAIRHLFVASYGQFNLLIADDVSHALKAIRNNGNQLAVILADHYLPDGTGIEVLAEARERSPDTVRLLTTSRADLSQAMEAVNEAGIAGFITKPWSLEDLRITLSQAVDLWTRRQRDKELLAGKRETLMSLASSIAHEMRTPLATIRMRAEAVGKHWPLLMALYKEAVVSGQTSAKRASQVKALEESIGVIEGEVERTNLVIEMLLASANIGRVDETTFSEFEIIRCVQDALSGYPFSESDKRKVRFIQDDSASFTVFGSDVLVIFTLYNLIKNALHAISAAGKGGIEIWLEREADRNRLYFRDTGMGIATSELPRIFEEFYSTKSVGTGVGLPFCRKAMRNMGGEIECEAEAGLYTQFCLSFPTIGKG